MGNSHQKISACLVVYNEEKVIQRCLDSIKELADEIIVVHDGECADKTLEIARKYTDKVFIREHVGVMEAHLAFALEQAQGEWLLRIDADEFFDVVDHDKIRLLLASSEANNGYTLNWELWDGKRTISLKGLQKSCFYRKKNFHYIGVPQEVGYVDGGFKKIDICLHHQPMYNNTSWKEFIRKAKKWIPIHVRYFFPELVRYECFNTTPDKWVNYANKVTKHPLYYLIVFPLKTFLGQLKNGLWTSWTGLKLVCQQYVCYLWLYWQIWQMKKSLNFFKKTR
jgi:glycosyltransferase involved in cell wall biosynthesis